MVQLLIDFGYWGMLVAAFLAGSFIPYSSEAVMVALQAALSVLPVKKLQSVALVTNTVSALLPIMVLNLLQPRGM